MRIVEKHKNTFGRFWDSLSLAKGWTAKVFVMSIKGDWKFLKQSMNLRRHPNAESICFSCLATKSGLLNFTDLSAEAPWRDTVGRAPLPWNIQPSLALLECFDLIKVGYDTLHIWNLGVARDLCLDHIKSFCGCLFAVLLRTPNLFVFCVLSV